MSAMLVSGTGSFLKIGRAHQKTPLQQSTIGIVSAEPLQFVGEYHFNEKELHLFFTHSPLLQST